MNRNFKERKPTKVYAKSKENLSIIKALNMYGRVPEQWELLDEIERLNNIIDLVVKDMEMTKYNPELPTYNSCVAVDKDHIQQWIDKLKELKEGK